MEGGGITGRDGPPAAQRRWLAPPLRWVAHRGGALEAPENTMPAFRRALRLGADALELDVRRCADGTLVVCHDASVERTTDGSGLVTDLTLSELRALDAAYWFVPGRGATGPAGGPRGYPLRGTGVGVPTFAEVLAGSGDAGLVVEVKERDAGTGEELARLVDAHGARERVLCASFHDAPLAALRRHGLATSASRSELARAWAVVHEPGGAEAPRLDAVALQVPLRHDGAEVVTPPLVRAAAARGLALHVWTVDEEDDVRRLEAAGVDGIITDRPGRFLHGPGSRRARA